MENLSIQDPPPGGAGNAQAPPPQSVPQLPPQMFTTAAQLLDLTDKKLILVLRDGRKMIGVLRTWDQFANIVLQDTIERIFVHEPEALFADVSRGVFIVRGENVSMIGEIDLDKEDDIPAPYRQAPENEVRALAAEYAAKRKKIDKSRSRQLGTHGFEAEAAGEMLF